MKSTQIVLLLASISSIQAYAYGEQESYPKDQQITQNSYPKSDVQYHPDVQYKEKPHAEEQHKGYGDKPKGEIEQNGYKSPPKPEEQHKDYNYPPQSKEEHKGYGTPPQAEEQHKDYPTPPHAEEQHKEVGYSQGPPKSENEHKGYGSPPQAAQEQKPYTPQAQTEQPPYDTPKDDVKTTAYSAQAQPDSKADTKPKSSAKGVSVLGGCAFVAFMSLIL